MQRKLNHHQAFSRTPARSLVPTMSEKHTCNASVPLWALTQHIRVHTARWTASRAHGSRTFLPCRLRPCECVVHRLARAQARSAEIECVASLTSCIIIRLHQLMRFSSSFIAVNLSRTVIMCRQRLHKTHSLRLLGYVCLPLYSNLSEQVGLHSGGVQAQSFLRQTAELLRV